MLYGEDMGRVRTRLIKRLASELVKKYPDKFSSDFSQNKQILGQLNIIEEKSMRNKVAGYIVRIVEKI